MAFKFFRRRQKTVVIIMVVLMVSFLLGFQGLKMIFGRTSGNPTFGTLADGRALRREDTQLAANDIQLLGVMTTVGQRVFQNLQGTALDRTWGYALLLMESESAGPASEGDIDAYLRNYLQETADAADDKAYQDLIAVVRSRGVAESTFRAAVGRLIRVMWTFERAILMAMPPEPRARRLFADLSEKISIRVAMIPAEKFLDQCSEPTAEELKAQFNSYREATPGAVADADQFAFGYRMPRRVRLQYLVLDVDRVTRTTRSDDAAARNYYIDHKDDEDFLEALNIDEAAAAELSAIPPKFSEVRQAISDRLVVEAVQTRMRNCLSAIDKLLADARESAEPAPYAAVLQQLMVAADDVLARPVAGVSIDGRPLSEAMAELARAANLSVISFPYGTYGGRVVDGTTEVRLSLGETTLAEALAQLCQQLDIPALQWVGLAPETGLGDALYAAGEPGSLPISVGQTPLVGRDELLKQEPLARAFTRGLDRIGLVTLAFRDELFVIRDEDKAALLDEQPRMQLLGSAPRGELFWRVVEIRDEEVLPEITDEQALAELDDDVRLTVTRDCKLIEAMELAGAAAERLAEQISQGQPFVATAAGAGHDTAETGEFARRSLGYTGYGFSIRPNPVPHLRLSPPVLQRFQDEAFSLPYAPQDDPFSDLRAVKALAFPRDASAFVIELVDHVPASGEEYLEQGRQMAMALLMQERAGLCAEAWFNPDNIVRRTGYEEPDSDETE